ncbi:zinc finger CCCH domain-containing protein 3 [Maniola hyperantus]|uniref:zinc finger CCCH domain-containing protein 3 n=1 Tax=Aphantopus hyperantus TaxID=2795564 RepID=UPI001568A26B|nr:zinc finger CCCH domain-containing protein 3 [Maniola hyperantus]
MEQSLHKRVYINPNFKRTELDPWPTEPVKTTHFNRHYLEEVPNRVTNTKINQPISNNRKIYVNPNFISCNNAALSKPPSGGYVNTNENVNNVSSRQLLHKSKYSLIQNFQQTVVNEEQAIAKVQTILESDQNTKKLTQEVPLTRSRYCIIRRKKRLSVNAEYKSINNLASELVNANKYPVPIACTNQLTYTNLHVVKNCTKSKPNHNTPEKITKIKITRYKMIPLSYLKNNAVTETIKNKFFASPFKSYLKSNTKLSSLISCNTNRFKFIKTSTPMKTSTPVSSIKAASRITQLNKKGVLCNGKAKLSRVARAKFNINNIPCRLFTKYGKCLRQVQGNCKYLHDKKHVSLCHKFLKGICHDKNCTLSHELTDKKMPTCYFYLKGMCTKESCPYLHVKLSDKTKICQEFVKGYCESGDKCLFRHVNIDKLKRTKKVSSNSFQRSPQSKVMKTKLIKMEKEYTENCDTMKNSEDTTGRDEVDCRYYKELVNSDDSYETIKPTRCKLGTLPSFIQL